MPGPAPDTEYEQPHSEPALPWQEQFAKSMREQAQTTEGEGQ